MLTPTTYVIDKPQLHMSNLSHPAGPTYGAKWMPLAAKAMEGFLGGQMSWDIRLMEDVN